MLRKVESSAGAGLNGGSMGDIEEALEMVGLAGGLPELFLGLGIVATLCRRGSPGETDNFDDNWKLGTSSRSPRFEH